MCRMVARPPLAVSKPFSEYLTIRPLVPVNAPALLGSNSLILPL
jgi:hypothetical protein